MTPDQLKQSLLHAHPPAHGNALVQALWHDAKGNWDAAHNIAQDVHTRDGSWMHAYLHRKEGDLGNAAYWYSLAHKPVCKKSLADEWDDLATAFLSGV